MAVLSMRMDMENGVSWRASQVGELLDMVSDGEVSGRVAKDVLEIMCLGDGDGEDRAQRAAEAVAVATPAVGAAAAAAAVGDRRSPREIVNDKGWWQLTDESGRGGELTALCRAVSFDAKYAQQLEALRSGKVQLLGFFVGRVMEASNGRAHPQQTNDILRKILLD